MIIKRGDCKILKVLTPEEITKNSNNNGVIDTTKYAWHISKNIEEDEENKDKTLER